MICVCIVDDKCDRAIVPLLDEHDWWLRGARGNMHFVEDRRLTLLPVQDCRDPVAVGDARLGALEVDGETIRVPGRLGAGVAQCLVDAVTFRTLDLAPGDVHLVRRLVEADRDILGW